MTIQSKEPFEGFHPISVSEDFRRRGLYRDHLKRIIDIGLVLLSLPVVLPLLCMVALAIFVMDHHSPIFWSSRIGRGGRVFHMMKLRTMVPDAQTRLTEHLASDPVASVEWNTTQKLKDDPRITRFGRFLRKSSLDELPQLWNVLKGDMSLVGPRPMMPDQRVLYPGWAYFELRPGVTGPWQVSARNLSTFAARADYDGEYVRDLSFMNDLRLLLRTCVVVYNGTGY